MGGRKVTGRCSYHLCRYYYRINSSSILRCKSFIFPEAQVARNYGTEIIQIPCKNYDGQIQSQDYFWYAIFMLRHPKLAVQNLVVTIKFSLFICCFGGFGGCSFTRLFPQRERRIHRNHSCVHYSLSKFTGKWFTNHSNHIQLFTPITRKVATKVQKIRFCSVMVWGQMILLREKQRGWKTQGKTYHKTPS